MDCTHRGRVPDTRVSTGPHTFAGGRIFLKISCWCDPHPHPHPHPSPNRLLKAHWPDFPRRGESWAALTIPAPADLADPRRTEFLAFQYNATAQWCARLSAAIRAADPARRITVGVQSGPVDPDTVTASACAPYIDFFSIHLYSSDANTSDALRAFFTQRLDALPGDAGVTDVAWEEFYPLTGSADVRSPWHHTRVPRFCAYPSPRRPRTIVYRSAPHGILLTCTYSPRLAQIKMEALPAICAAAAADIKRPLSVVARYSFYWGSASSLDMAPLQAAIYNEWLSIWAAARPW